MQSPLLGEESRRDATYVSIATETLSSPEDECTRNGTAVQKAAPGLEEIREIERSSESESGSESEEFEDCRGNGIYAIEEGRTGKPQAARPGRSHVARIISVLLIGSCLPPTLAQ